MPASSIFCLPILPQRGISVASSLSVAQRVDHVARADLVQQLLRVGGVRGVLHRVEVIQVAEELIEAVDGGQELIEIAEVVLAELARGITHVLERRGDGAGLGGQPDLARPPGRPWSCRCGSAISPVMKFARPAVQLASA